jgi:hypothetical protein
MQFFGPETNKSILENKFFITTKTIPTGLHVYKKKAMHKIDPNGIVLYALKINCVLNKNVRLLQIRRYNHYLFFYKCLKASVYKRLSQFCRFEELHGFVFNRQAFDCLKTI